MKLKYRLPLYFSLIFSILLALVMLTVYFLFSNFRYEEFKARISERGQTAGKLLIEVKEVDSQLFKIIDENSVRKLYNERILIFDQERKLLYRSRNDLDIEWSNADLDAIKKKKEFFKSEKAYDLLGLYYEYQNKGYYVLVYAQDNGGYRKLDYLKFLLVGAFLFGTALVWLLSFYISKKTLAPLERVRKQITEITSKNLTVRLFEPKTNDEILALSQSFNQMINRIEMAYKSQKDFTSNASHELRTPVARIVMQLENSLQSNKITQELREALERIAEDAYQLSDIITSLLLLSNIDPREKQASFELIRLDELVFYCSSKMQKTNPDFRFHFEIENDSGKEVSMEIRGDEALLKIALLNLFKNAYDYSNDHSVKCILRQGAQMLQLFIINTGETPDRSEIPLLFDIFSRGSNSKTKYGSGVGLSIVKRILNYHQAEIIYDIVEPNINEIRIDFPLDILS